ncbi:MAG: DUF5060 domain-containing protein, partial [Armatimonadetes bacterium]|nr:DUF5060 domain-containing protein [Armatimonadota bacterium]
MLCFLHLPIVLAVAGALRFSFDTGPEDWVPSPLDAGSQVAHVPAAHGKSGLLKIGGHTPPSFGASYRPWQDWRPYEWVTFDLFIPETAPDDLSLYAYIKDRQYLWYQTPLLADPLTGLRRFTQWRGLWLHIGVDISPRSRAWQPGGHQKTWAGATFYPREFGIRAFSSKEWEGEILIDNICLWGHRPPLGKRDPNAAGTVVRGLEVHPSASEVPVGEKIELTFYLDRDYENPFDPEVVDVTGHFLSPSGRKIAVPGFYYQDYLRLQTPEGYEKLVPVGQPCWK